MFIPGCAKEENVNPESNDAFSIEERSSDKIRTKFEQEILVANVAGYDADIIDPNLVNAWGIAINPTGIFWISAAETELSVVYTPDGVTVRPPVTIDGEPTGQVFNGATGFMIPGLGTARFIFATEDGKITGLRTGNVAQTMVDRSAMGAVYTGLEIASDGTGNYLYAANVAGGAIDVFDMNWMYVTNKPFNDPSLPAGASPFNMRLIDGKMYVNYVRPGGGFVNIFNTDGTFVERFASGGKLCVPWGITNTPPEFGLGNAILIGNLGDGRINIYNKNGHCKGQLGDDEGNPIMIDGLWALIFTAGAFNGTTDVDLYFTAGPNN